MANWNDNQQSRPDSRGGFGSSPAPSGSLAGAQTMDAGLRAHMLSIYNYMASGVLLTGIVAMLADKMGWSIAFASGPLMWLVALSPLAVVFAMSFGQQRFSTATLQAMFWTYTVLMGLSLSTIFLVYTDASIAVTFLATAGAFAGLSLWGYTTGKDISGWGSFLIMGVVGLIIASLLNTFFFQSGPMGLAISAIGVLIFAGLTAYDTQRLKNDYIEISQARMYNPEIAAAYPLGKMVIMGALTLYLDFINMFIMLLRLMGNRE